MVEILLKNLDQAQKAFDLVRNNPTSSAAQLIAEYCQANSDYRGTIEFLLIANKIDDAFKLAAQQNMMETFTSFLGESISSEDAVKVANFYEKLSDFSKANPSFFVLSIYFMSKSNFSERSLDFPRIYIISSKSALCSYKYS